MEGAFELLHEIGEGVKTGLWVGDCFVYTNTDGRLNYCVGGEVTTLFHLDRPLWLLGYLAGSNRLYLLDREYSVVSYTLLLSLVELKTLVLRGDLDGALQLLPSLPAEARNGVARFLEARGHVAQALQIATDPEYRFELALALGDVDTAHGIAEQLGSEQKWKQLAELALAAGDLARAEPCLWKAADLSGLLLLYSCTGDAAGMARLGDAAAAAGKHNVAFVCLLLQRRTPDCVRLLSACGRLPEAAFVARTYAPGAASEAVAQWRADLAKVNAKAAEALADPGQYPNLFRDWALALQAEQLASADAATVRPAAQYPALKDAHKGDPLQRLRDGAATAETAEEDQDFHEAAAGEEEAAHEEALPTAPATPPAAQPQEAQTPADPAGEAEPEEEAAAFDAPPEGGAGDEEAAHAAEDEDWGAN